MLPRMTQIFKIGSPAIEIHLRRSPRAKRYLLRVSNADGQVHLTLPRKASVPAALNFARAQEGWLRAKLANRRQRQMPAFGQEFPFMGQAHILTPTTERQVRKEGLCLYVPGPATTLPARLRGFLKVEARNQLAHSTHFHARRLERDILRLTLRDTRSRWGSCSAVGSLSFSWRLIMAPPPILDYVAAHEVAHLVEMNHTPAFWNVVERLMPDFRTHRRWLKENGAELHRYAV